MLFADIIKKRSTEYFFFLFTVLIVLVWFVAFPLDTSFDSADIFFEGLYFVVAFCSFYIVKRTNINPLSLGWAIFVYGLLIDLLDEFTIEPSLFDTKIEGLLTAIGLMLVGMGLYKGVQNLQQEIAQRKSTEEKLRLSEENYRQEKDYLENVLDNSADAVVIVDRHGRFLRRNKKAYEMFGSSFEQQKKAFEVYAYQEEMENILNSLRKNGQVIDYEASLKKMDSIIFPAALSISLLFDANGEKTGSVSVIRDLTKKKKLEKKLVELSYHDIMTGLHNRTFFEEEMRRLGDGRYNPMGIIVCDINGLKLVNDTLGHSKGDKMLKATADILKRCFRASDIVTRIGGDEFAVLLPQSGEEVVKNCCHRIRKQIEHYNNQNPEISLSISIGYAVEESPFVDMTELFKKADDDMYKEKSKE